MLAGFFLALLLTTAAPGAFPAQPRSREEAVAALAGGDENGRADAIAWIAEHGTMADAAALQARLWDASARVRAYAEQGLWRLWTRGDDPQIDARMAHGTQAMQAGNLDEAIYDFTTIIRARPDFAEGWNRRATAYFLAGDDQRSAADCREVLKRNPGHFGALSGMGQIELRRGNDRRALEWFQRALEVNPNMASVRQWMRAAEARIAARRREAI